MSEQQDIVERRLASALQWLSSLAPEDVDVDEVHAVVCAIESAAAELTDLREQVERLERAAKVAQDRAAEWCHMYLDANWKNNLAVLAERKLHHAALAPTQPAKEHQWDRKHPSKMWWCETCKVCGGNKEEPADIGPCKGVPQGGDFEGPPAKEPVVVENAAFYNCTSGTANPKEPAAATPDPRGLVEAAERVCKAEHRVAMYGAADAFRGYIAELRNALATYRKGADDGRA